MHDVAVTRYELVGRVIGCNSFASWLLALAKTCKKHLLYFNFISARPHICNEKKIK